MHASWLYILEFIAIGKVRTEKWAWLSRTFSVLQRSVNWDWEGLVILLLSLGVHQDC